MAYVEKYTHETVFASGTTLTITPPTHSTDDLLVIIITPKFGTLTTPTDFTEEQDCNNDGHQYVWWYVAGGTPKTTITSTAGSSGTSCSVLCVVVKEAPTTSPISLSGERTSTATQDCVVPSITPSDANCLIIAAAGASTTPQSNQAPCAGVGYGYLGNNADDSQRCQAAVWTFHKPASTATPTFNFPVSEYRSTNTSFNGVVIAIKDKGNSYFPGYCKVSADADKPSELVSRHGSRFEHGDIAQSDWDPSVWNTPGINGYSVDTSDDGGGQNYYILDHQRNPRLRSNLTDQYLANGSSLTTAVDLSGSILAITIAYIGSGFPAFAVPGVVVGLSNGTYGRLWDVAGNDTVPRLDRGIFPVTFEVDGGFELSSEDVGTFDSTSIDKTFVGCFNTTQQREWHIGALHKLQTLIMIGGSSALPCSMSDAKAMTVSCQLNTIQDQIGQSATQFFVMQDMTIGDGGTTDVYWDSVSQAIEFASAPDEASTPIRVQNQISEAALTFEIDAGTGNTVKIGSVNMGDYHNFVVTSGAVTFENSVVRNATPNITPVDSNISNLTLTGCKELTLSGNLSGGGCKIDGCVDTYAVTVTSEAEFNALRNVDFTNNNYSIRITGNHGGDTWTATGMTVSGGTGSYDIQYTGTGALTIEVDTGSGWTDPRAEATTGTLTISAPTLSFTLTSSESGSDLKIFDTTTQTIEASGTGTTINTTNTGTYDWTVQKAGFLPQRGTGVALTSSSVAVNVTLAEDPVYNSSHGLTFTTDYSYAPATRILTIVANQEGRDLYSALIDDFISETSLRNVPFPLVAVGPDRIDFKAVGTFSSSTTVGATIDSGDIQFWKGAGMEWEHDTTGNPTKKFYSIKSANTLQTGSVVGYTQQNNGSATEITLVSDQVNEVIQFFEDTDGNGTPDYEYNSHLLFKGFKTGFYQARWDVINDSGISTLEPYEYTINLLQDTIAGTTGDQGVTITTLTDHTSSPLSVGGKSFDYELVDPAVTSAEDLLSQYNYDVFNAVDTSITSTLYTSYNAFDLPDLIIESGANYESERGYFEGDGAVTDLSGVYISRSGDHPGITRFQSNDGTYYTPAVTSNISITGMPTAGNEIRLQITNNTAKTASTWASTTAYSQKAKALRSTGLGSENTAGLYYVATTGGTSGGSEPTWPTTPGGTVVDGTVTWTCYAILYYDADPASSGYSDSYIDGEEFDTGDEYGVRFSELNTTTSFKTFDTTGIVSSTGFTVPVSVTADSVYATNGVDGSSTAVTDKFTANYTLDYIVLDADQDFAATEAYAYYCYELTTTDGMYGFWDAVTAIDTANYRINTSVVNILFDESAGFVKQTDSARIFNDLGTRPAIDPTTGGNGLEINWRNPVYAYDGGGGGFTSGDRATLDAAATAAALTTVDANVDAILLDTGTTLPAQITAVDGKIDTIDTNVDSILVDTDTTIPALIAAVDTVVNDIIADTGSSIPTQISALQVVANAIAVDTATDIPALIAALNDYNPATDTSEGSETYQETIRLIRAVLVGKSAQSGTTETFRDLADTKDRVTATVDEDGQRTSITTDAS